MALELVLAGAGIGGNAGNPLYLGGCALTVPAGQAWEPTAVHIKYNACAATGNRTAHVTFGTFGATTAQQITWEPVVAATQTRYFDGYGGCAARATYINSDHAIAPLPPGFIINELEEIIPSDLASICDDGLHTGTATAIDATTLTNAGAFPDGLVVGANLVVGSSTAVVTANTTDVLTFAGGWTGGTPAPGVYEYYFDTMEFTLAYNLYEPRQI